MYRGPKYSDASVPPSGMLAFELAFSIVNTLVKFKYLYLYLMNIVSGVRRETLHDLTNIEQHIND